MAGCEADVVAALRAFEEEVMDPRLRKNGERLMEVLAEGFREFGSSGRVWNRTEMIQALAEEKAAEIGLDGFVAERLSAGCVFVTYRTRRYDDGLVTRESVRSSIWVERGGRWTMVFHQGTKV